jgi:ABC-type anion transport system duplicated permease subunit
LEYFIYLIGGLKIIPHDIIDAAKVFNIKGFRYFRKVLFPAIIPQLVTGSIIAVAQGWNIIIIAEVCMCICPKVRSSRLVWHWQYFGSSFRQWKHSIFLWRFWLWF